MWADALAHYSFDNPQVQFIRHNENITYKVVDGAKSFLLRIHQPIDGFDLSVLRFDSSLADLVEGEMSLLAYLADNCVVPVQKVVPNRHGQLVSYLADLTPVTVLEWITGETLEQTSVTPQIAFALGETIGHLHNATAHKTFTQRYVYDAALLTRMIAEAEIAMDKGHFTSDIAVTIIAALSRIREYLYTSTQRTLIHGDIGQSNLVLHNNVLTPIDFSLSGSGIPEMDIASAYAHLNDDELNEAVFRGYVSVSDLAVSEDVISACFALQILLFVIMQHNKYGKDPKFQEDLVGWSRAYFEPLCALY